MRIGIDASNIRSGGGLAHLIKLLSAVNPISMDISHIILWGGHSTLKQIDNQPWLIKSQQKLLDKGLLYRIFWQKFKLAKLARKAQCNVLFVPGGSYAGSFKPVVTISQNLLPFEKCELKRYYWSIMTIRLMLLHVVQKYTFQRADGVIFLTHYAKKVIMSVIKAIDDKTAIIPHGIDETFIFKPRMQLGIDHYSLEHPYHILYVSKIDVYKHQVNVALAVVKLRQLGLPIKLSLIGPAYLPALKRLRKILQQVDPHKEFINYLGAVANEQLPMHYLHADLFLFASSCENLPIILLEAMASGLPIACSNYGPMPEVLSDAGLYFDPEDLQSIVNTLRELLDSPILRAKLAAASFERAKQYSWSRTAEHTFAFLKKIIEGT